MAQIASCLESICVIAVNSLCSICHPAIQSNHEVVHALPRTTLEKDLLVSQTHGGYFGSAGNGKPIPAKC